MNVHPSPLDFGRSAPAVGRDLPSSIEVEQAVLGRCLAQPEALVAACGALVAGDFSDPLHGAIFEAMRAMQADGRSPSIESVAAAMPGVAVAEDLPLREYLRRMVRGVLDGLGFSPRDAVETLRDASMRRRLIGMAGYASELATSGASMADIVSDVTAEIDEIAAGLRAGKRSVYDGSGAIDAAMAHLDGHEGSYPTTGLTDLDRILGGWPRGQLSILAGRPGMGKSAAATSALLRAARKGFAALFFSLEMTREQMGARLASDLAFVAASPIFYEDILHRRIDDRARARLAEARRHLHGAPMQIEEQRGLTLSEIAARSRKHAAQLDRDGQRLEVIFVDHIGLVRASNRYAGNRVREVAEISDGLATLAKELDCAVVGLCQLNRSVESRDNKRPSLADLRDSGAIEEDASTVTFIYRPAYYLENRHEDIPERESERLVQLEACRNTLEFVVAKNRNGRTGAVRAWCEIGANAIRDAAYGG